MKWMVLARGDMQEVMVEDIRDCMTICPIKIQISARLLILGLNNRGSATLLRRYSLPLQQCDTSTQDIRVYTFASENPARPRCIAWPILRNVKPHASIYLVPAIFSSAYCLPPKFQHAHTP